MLYTPPRGPLNSAYEALGLLFLRLCGSSLPIFFFVDKASFDHTRYSEQSTKEHGGLQCACKVANGAVIREGNQSGRPQDSPWRVIGLELESLELGSLLFLELAK